MLLHRFFLEAGLALATSCSRPLLRSGMGFAAADAHGTSSLNSSLFTLLTGALHKGRMGSGFPGLAASVLSWTRESIETVITLSKPLA